MAANYCQECGSELESGAAFCTNCGTAVDDATGAGGGQAGPTMESDQTEVAGTGGSESESMFRMTAALVGGYFLFVIVGVGASIPALAGLGVLCLLASLVTMYLDLRELDEQLWGTRPILWVIGAALLYVVVGPLYVYKRRQVV